MSFSPVNPLRTLIVLRTRELDGLAHELGVLGSLG